MKLAFIALAVVATVTVQAQNFNIDLGGTVAPGSSYGAAKGQTGHWHNVTDILGGTSGPIMDITGAATGVTLDTTSGMFSFTFNNASTSGDDENLLDDQFDLGVQGSSHTFSINGLASGPYNVFIYAWASDSDLSIITTTINGNSQQTGGAYTGLVAGVTHGVWLNVNAVGGTISFSTFNDAGFGSLNGIQLSQVPEPATMAVLGLGALAAIRRKRTK